MSARKVFWLCSLVASFALAFHPFVPGLGQRIAEGGSSASAKADSSSRSASVENAPNRLFMWKVSNGKNSIYLLGSIHLVKPDFYPMPPDIERAFQKSSVLILEVDETKGNPAELQMMMLSKGKYSGGDNLKNHITKKTAQALDKYIVDHGDPMRLTTMRPWLASMMIPMMELTRLGFDPKQGVDKHFLNQAAETGKNTDEIESAEFQLNVMSGFSDDLQDKLLYSSLIDLEDTDKAASDLMKAWRDGSPEEMEEVVTKDEKDHPELKEVTEKVVYERNESMVKKIEEYLQSDNKYFVVVGSAHLVGKRGILQLLRDKKYQVDQVLRTETSPAEKKAS